MFCSSARIALEIGFGMKATWICCLTGERTIPENRVRWTGCECLASISLANARRKRKTRPDPAHFGQVDKASVKIVGSDPGAAGFLEAQNQQFVGLQRRISIANRRARTGIVTTFQGDRLGRA
jgi:hypothetical protein